MLAYYQHITLLLLLHIIIVLCFPCMTKNIIGNDIYIILTKVKFPELTA